MRCCTTSTRHIWLLALFKYYCRTRVMSILNSTRLSLWYTNVINVWFSVHVHLTLLISLQPSPRPSLPLPRSSPPAHLHHSEEGEPDGEDVKESADYGVKENRSKIVKEGTIRHEVAEHKTNTHYHPGHRASLSNKT